MLCGLFGCNNQVNGCSNLCVQLQIDFVLTSLADGTSWQTNFALAYLNTGSSYGISDILGTDRTKQFAFFTGIGCNGNQLDTGQLIGARLGSAQLFSSDALKLGTT